MWPALGSVLTSAGPWGLLGFVVVSLVLGWLIPARTHERIVRSMERQIDAQDKQIIELKAQVAILSSGQRVASGAGS